MSGDHGAGGHVHGAALSDDEMRQFKIIFIVLNFLVTYLGLLPRVIPECRNNEAVLSVLNCFSAGIFLAMAVMHLFPGMEEAYRNWAIVENIGEPFPTPYIIVFASYVAMVFIDRVLVSKWHVHDAKGIYELTHKDDKNKIAFQNLPEVYPGTPVKDADNLETTNNQVTDKKNQMFSGEVTVTKTTAIMLVVAISFHAIFEGIAFGLLTEIETAWELGIGIMLHETTAAISLGAALSKSGFSLKQMFFILSLFTLLTPTGIIIGMVISSAANALLDVVFMAISIGTFLYVASGEVIVNEFKNGKNLWAKFIAVFMGGVVTILLWFIESENHTHGPAMDWTKICAEYGILVPVHEHLLR